MRNRSYKIIIFILCLVVLITLLSKTFIICDTHIHLNISEECNKCLLIYNIRELIKNILRIDIIILFFIGINIIRKVIENNKNNIYINLVWLKVRLNE